MGLSAPRLWVLRARPRPRLCPSRARYCQDVTKILNFDLRTQRVGRGKRYRQKLASVVLDDQSPSPGGLHGGTEARQVSGYIDGILKGSGGTGDLVIKCSDVMWLVGLVIIVTPEAGRGNFQKPI